MKIFLKMSLFLLPILNVLYVPVQAMDPEDTEDTRITIIPTWQEYTTAELGVHSPKVTGRIEDSSFWINVEKTGTTFSSIKGLYAWWLAQWDYMQGTRYSIADWELAAMLCVVGDYKLNLEYILPYAGLSAFNLIKLHYNESEDQANEDFSASFKEKYPDITEICLVAPNFSSGVALIKDEDLSPLEKILQNKGIQLRYGTDYK